jgi:hypothetical protein
MMPIAALALFFGFKPGVSHSFDVAVNFDGYVPIFGGRNGKADVKMTVLAQGVKSSNGDLLAATSEITDITVNAFGSVLPLNKDNVSQFFPKGTAEFLPWGEVKTNTAPAVVMPAKLPGLDSQRLPEISFLPLELPMQEPTKGLRYSFKRLFNGNPMTYDVTVNSSGEKNVMLTFKLSQKETGFEDAYKNQTEDKAKAKFTTDLKLDGSGIAIFDIASGCFDQVELSMNAESEVKNIKTGAIANRNLKTTLKINRVKK